MRAPRGIPLFTGSPEAYSQSPGRLQSLRWFSFDALLFLVPGGTFFETENSAFSARQSMPLYYACICYGIIRSGKMQILSRQVQTMKFLNTDFLKLKKSNSLWNVWQAEILSEIGRLRIISISAICTATSSAHAICALDTMKGSITADTSVIASMKNTEAIITLRRPANFYLPWQKSTG